MNTKKIPYKASDLNQLVAINIDLKNHRNFQLMHIEIGKGYSYAIIAKFKGKRINKKFYAIKQINFKFIPIDDSGEGLCIHDVQFEELCGGIKKFTLFINPFKDGDSVETYTYCFAKTIIVNKKDILDIHIHEIFYKQIELSQELIKGKQCHSKIIF